MMKPNIHITALTNAHYRYMLVLTLFRLKIVSEHDMKEVYNSVSAWVSGMASPNLFPDPY